MNANSGQGNDDGGLPGPAGQPQLQRTVLVVDDYESLSALIACQLSGLGYRVLSATNGTDALRMLASEAPAAIDLLLTDVEMPEMRGEELAEWFRERWPEAKVLFMSTSQFDVRSPMEFHFLRKPFDLNELGNHVRDVIEDRDVICSPNPAAGFRI